MGSNGNGNGKKCPMCNKSIFEWECLCAPCWKQVKLHDAMHGTSYIEDFLAGNKPTFGVDDSLAEQIKWIKNKRKAMLKDICTELCKKCSLVEESKQLPTKPKDPDLCKECKWYKYMNYLMSEYNGD
jgi:hypothetical protein